MAANDLTTGLTGLDRALRGLLPGDNVVWLVDSVDDYAPFVEPYCRSVLASPRRLIYFRFAEHPALLSAESGAEIRELKPEQGFEKFITDIHKTIEEAGRGAFYVFDCLSNLASDWHSDQMLGNFFMLTCPYLFDLETVAYFALRRNLHSFHAATPIAETAQVLLDVHRHKGRIYVHPLKVQHRHSPTMYMLHVREGEDFVPVTDSITNSEVLQSVPMAALDSGQRRIGTWSRTFLEAERLWEAWRGGARSDEEVSACLGRLLRMVVSREERVLRLAEKHFTLGDILDLRRRMIGTGLIGGKSVGMLLARAILRGTAPHWADLLEPHDSFFIGSDVFYTYVVHNGCWSIRQRQCDPGTFLEGAERARQRMLRGTFPDHIRRQFADMLDYFGQSPIIVRSSSLLEDNFGNAFAGKYESVFCANQGPRETRLEDFMSAVRSIYASTMSEKALTYRARRGLLDRDEQMGLLVQRVSGNRYGCLFYSQVSGVGFS
ncbi:MAG TPA: PEP/pyruvate-binding domain-containing protein, partial [Sumerlaeia bacterium]|nr:PEP/pyruvate-binding domain-containing protein [Sumerlaeia bacterium]